MERAETRLGLAISALERQDESAATAVLDSYMDDEEERITRVGLPCHVQSHAPWTGRLNMYNA